MVRMLRLYLLSASALFLIIINGCRPDPPTRLEQVAPALADTLDLDSLTNSIGQADTTPVRRDWHRLTKVTDPRAPLVVYRGVRKLPSALAASSLSSEATLFDVARKASEYFQINPTQAAEIRGRNGTVLRLAAGTLVDARQRAVMGPVWVELKECYAPAEMLLTNLTTMSADGQPLKTGGMVLVQATAEGQPLQMADGSTLHLEMPASKGQPLRDMQLYYGQSTSPISWVAAPEINVVGPTETIYTEAQPMPSYGTSVANINRLVRYPQEALASETQGVVFASFVVDESGRVQSPRIVRGIGHGCDEEVLRVLRQTSGRWTPGQRDGAFVKVKMVLPIRFSFQPGQLSADTSRINLTASTEDATVESLSTQEPTETMPADRYVFRCSQLGWFNVSKYLSGNSAGALTLPFEGASEATAVRLVLRSATPTVLAGQLAEGGYQFEGVPMGRRAVLVGLRYEGGVPSLAFQEIITGSNSTTALEFRETTLEELERQLEKL